MALSPNNLEFMTAIVGQVMTKHLLMPESVDMTDRALLICVALYMSRDAESKAELETALQSHGSKLREAWHGISTVIVGANDAEAKRAKKAVQDVLRRV